MQKYFYEKIFYAEIICIKAMTDLILLVFLFIHWKKKKPLRERRKAFLTRSLFCKRQHQMNSLGKNPSLKSKQ